MERELRLLALRKRAFALSLTRAYTVTLRLGAFSLAFMPTKIGTCNLCRNGPLEAVRVGLGVPVHPFHHGQQLFPLGHLAFHRLFGRQRGAELAVPV